MNQLKNEDMSPAIAEATRLTRAGALMEATALIRRTLERLTTRDSHGADRENDSVIEGDCAVVEEVPRPEAATSEKDRARSTVAGTSSRAPFADMTSPVNETAVDRSEVVSAAPTDAHSTGKMKWPERLHSLLRFRQGGDRPLIDRADGIPARPRTEGDSGQFIDGSYTNRAGTRDYKLYIPGGYRGQALPLIVMLHGCTQNPDDAAAGTRLNALAEEELFLVAYPAQAASANQNKCWNWFQTNDQQRDRGEPSIIAGITQQVVRDYRLDARRVYITGMSAGGAMAATMAAEYPDLYAAVGVHSGLAHGAARDMPSAFAAMRSGAAGTQQAGDGFSAKARNRIVPTIVFHGDSDNTVHPRNGDQVLAQMVERAASDFLAKPRVTLSQGQVPDGRAYSRSVYHDVNGQEIMERWLVHGAGHAWSGGSRAGSYTDPQGPDASREMVSFFYKHAKSESVLAVDG